MRKKKGFSLIEIIACLVLLSIMMVVIGRLSLTRTANSMGIDAQYNILAADGWLSDIYRDFHMSQDIEYESLDNGVNQITFQMPDGLKTIYSFNKQTGWCYTNGVEQFRATRFEVVGTGNNINIEVKLPQERLLSMNIYG